MVFMRDVLQSYTKPNWKLRCHTDVRQSADLKSTSRPLFGNLSLLLNSGEQHSDRRSQLRRVSLQLRLRSTKISRPFSGFSARLDAVVRINSSPRSFLARISFNAHCCRHTLSTLSRHLCCKAVVTRGKLKIHPQISFENDLHAFKCAFLVGQPLQNCLTVLQVAGSMKSLSDVCPTAVRRKSCNKRTAGAF